MSVEWQTTDIEVIIRDTHGDDGLSGQTGIIRGISVSIKHICLLFNITKYIIGVNLFGLCLLLKLFLLTCKKK